MLTSKKKKWTSFSQKVMDFLKKKYWTAKKKKKKTNKIVSVLLSATVERFSVSRMWDFFLRIELDWRAFVELRISNFEKQKSFFEKKYLILFLDILKK